MPRHTGTRCEMRSHRMRLCKRVHMRALRMWWLNRERIPANGTRTRTGAYRSRLYCDMFLVWTYWYYAAWNRRPKALRMRMQQSASPPSVAIAKLLTLRHLSLGMSLCQILRRLPTYRRRQLRHYALSRPETSRCVKRRLE